jgi:hypothetical protein
MEDTVPVIPQSSAHKNIPLEDILEMQSNNPNLTHKEMAKLLGCSRKNITQRLAACGATTKSLERYQAYEGKVIANIRKKMADSLATRTPDELKDVSVRDLAVTFGVLYDKGRLEEGKSTSNVSIADAAGRLADSIGGLQDELKALEDTD